MFVVYVSGVYVLLKCGERGFFDDVTKFGVRVIDGDAS